MRQEEARNRDRAAVERTRAGDGAAWAEVVRRHGPDLHRVLARIVGDAHLAEDLLQETFVRAWRALERYDASRPLFPWLRTIGVNLALKEIRRRSRRAEVGDGEEVLPHLPAPGRSDAAVRQRELVEATTEILATLPPEWAAVLRLRSQEQMSYAEIAEALEMPVGSVMSRLARARARVAQALRERFGPLEELGHD